MPETLSSPTSVGGMNKEKGMLQMWDPVSFRTFFRQLSLSVLKRYVTPFLLYVLGPSQVSPALFKQSLKAISVQIVSTLKRLQTSFKVAIRDKSVKRFEIMY